jgi:hypothetical protein
MISNQVQNNPLQAAAQNQVQGTLNGDYLHGNQYLDAQFSSGANKIANAYGNALAGTASGAEAGGRYGSGMQAFQNSQAQQNLGSSLGDLWSQTYGNNYNMERQNQINAVGQSAGVQNQGITNANALGEVGSAQDQYAQANIDADINKWNYNQNLPYNKLANYLSLINGNYGSSTSTSTPTSGNNWLGQAIGGGLVGLGAYNSFGGG